jgi:hypothetical protein
MCEWRFRSEVTERLAMRALVFDRMMRIVYFEHAVKHGNLDEIENVLVNVAEDNLAAMLLHLSISN